ncbi:chlorophyll synthase ChlG [Jiella sonneratiae]|uniref:Chlorophyll synthase ChlG n=1 Tax=Jiella sonneratiae TaxID=2816856 RepID=A0ABS3J6T3_9HYPH|nr:chlorophyll synthase ChlG [Jiella sonneratiae]MBO0905391.1 chlorophyll synthase ChlG [Jiella sonneratiae]
MSRSIADPSTPLRPSLSAGIELLKPITWFAPMWAFGCGAISARAMARPGDDTLWIVLAGVVLAGPLLCGASQVVNDWYDRDVDAINEPNRPIPSGRMPGRSAFHLALFWTGLSLAVAFALGPWVGIASALGCLLSFAYSAPPLRLKRNGWWGNAAVAFAYEGLAWFTGAAVVAGGLPDARIIFVAYLYSIGAHGIMTLNDFKAIEGDVALGVRTLPVQYGVEAAALIACAVMTVPQLLVTLLLVAWGAPWHGLVVALLVVLQLGLMRRFVADPRGRAPWYNATGTSLYVLGMMVAAFAFGGILGG